MISRLSPVITFKTQRNMNEAKNNQSSSDQAVNYTACCAPVLHLNLIRKWFDIIGDQKNEEYRAITPYWSRIFSNGKIKIKGKYYHPTDVVVCFSNGYAKDRPQKTFKVKGLKVGFGHSLLGAEFDTQYFILQIGERLS
jgi:hypothetical protein